MARILVRDLVPGGTYYVQVRANSGSAVSDWSPRYQIVASSDLIAPAQPTGLSFVVSGTSFAASWSAVTTNSDASALQDLLYYEVKFTAGANSYIVNVGKALAYTLSYEENVAYLGTSAAVGIEVRAVDQTGNKSTPATASATNPAPANVSNLVVTGLSDSLQVSWDKVADTDIKQYEVYVSTSGSGFTPSGANLVYAGPNNVYVYPTTTYTTTWVKVRAVDLFNTPSAAYTTGSATPKQSTAVDVTAPGAPTAVTVTTGTDTTDPTGGTSFIDVSWTAPADTDLQNYNVRYSLTNGSNWQYINVPAGTTSTRINELSPNTAYYIAVNAQDYSKNQSAFTNAGTFPITTQKDTTAPPQVVGLVVVAGVTTVTASWTESTATDVAGGVGIYEVQLDTANTFATGNLQTRRVNGTIASFSGLTSNTQYFVRVRAFDATANAGTYSATGSATTAYVTTNDIQAGSINGDRITAATINGDRIIANTLDAATIKAGTTFTQNLNVGSTFTMAASGIMKSSNYVAGTTGWQLSQNTLEINGGTVRAAALAIQDSANLIPQEYSNFEFMPSFYTLGSGIGGGFLTLAVNTTGVKFGTQYITGSWTTSSNVPQIYFGRNGADYNIPIQQSTTYIYSLWARNNTGAASTLKLTVSDDTATATVVLNTTVPSTNTWARYSGTYTTTATANKVMCWIQGDATAGLGTGWDIDAVQFERQIGNLTTPSPWVPPGVTNIDGAIIRTGQIQSTSTVTVNSVSQPAWSINMSGGAQFGNATIRGTLTVGTTGDPDAGQSYVASGNYSVGTAGWKIQSNGNAEFNSGTFRGTVSGASIIGGTLSIPVDATNFPSRTYIDQDLLKHETQATTNLIPDPGISVTPTINASTSGTVTGVGGAPVTDWLGNIDYLTKIGTQGFKFYHTTNGSATVAIDIAPTGTLATNTTYTLSFYTANAVGTTNAPVFGDSYGNMGNLKVFSTGNDLLSTGGKFFQFQGNIFYGANWSNSGANYTNVQTMFGLGWQKRVYITFTTPSTLAGTGLRLQLPVPCTSGGAAIDQAGYVCGFQLEQKSYPTRYCDGNQPWCSWSGTANASTSSRNFGITNFAVHSSGDAIYTADLDINRSSVRKFKMGSGAYRGSNFYGAGRAGSFTTATAVITNVVYDTPSTGDRFAADDGSIYSNPGTGTQLISQVPGPFVFSMAQGLPAGNTAGNRQIRVISQGGTVQGVTNVVGTIGQITLQISGMCIPPGGGYYLLPGVYQSSGVTLTWPASSGTLPCTIVWGQVG